MYLYYKTYANVNIQSELDAHAHHHYGRPSRTWARALLLCSCPVSPPTSRLVRPSVRLKSHQSGATQYVPARVVVDSDSAPFGALLLCGIQFESKCVRIYDV